MKNKIGNFKPKNKFFLAPMEEINDSAFRIICKRAGCGLTYTGMINPQTKQEVVLKDKPALQLFCKTTKGIKEFIKKYDSKVSLWDFNLGCPAKTAQKHKFGSYLTDLKTIEEIMKTIRSSTKKPVTLKLRKSSRTFEILKIAERYCDAISIHSRTRSQGYSGKPDLKFAEELKSKTKLPVIYSGDVNEKNAKLLLEKFDFVMVGREAIGRPEIFSKLANKKVPKNIQFRNYLKLAKKYNVPFRTIKSQAMNFTKGKRNSKKLRLEIFKIKNMASLEEFSK